MASEKRREKLEMQNMIGGAVNINYISTPDIWAFLILAIFTTIRREFSGPFRMKYGDFRDRNLNRYLQCNVDTQSSSHRGVAGCGCSIRKPLNLTLSWRILNPAAFWILEVMGNYTRDPYWHNWCDEIFCKLSALELSNVFSLFLTASWGLEISGAV